MKICKEKGKSEKECKIKNKAESSLKSAGDYAYLQGNFKEISRIFLSCYVRQSIKR